MDPIRLSHHAMVVASMDRAIETYCGQLGMRLLRRKAGVAYSEVAMVEDPRNGCRIELLLQEGCGESRLDHVAFEVDDVDGAYERLRTAGFSVEREPFDVPGTTVRTSFLRAPDGVKIELMHYATRRNQGTESNNDVQSRCEDNVPRHSHRHAQRRE